MYFCTFFIAYFYKNNKKLLKTTLNFILVLDYFKFIIVSIFMKLITNIEPKLYYFCFVGIIILILNIEPKTTI